MATRALAIATLCALAAASVVAEEIRPGVFRTPDERFADLPDFPFEPHYADVNGYRMHYLDEGPADGQPILLLHGEPTWSYLYRKMIPVLTAAGHRCIVPDLIGFGRSDKPADMDTHTYKFHVDNVAALVEHLNLADVTFFGQDWGGLIGLRVVAENPDWFARIVVANTGLPAGDLAPDELNAFMQWKRMNQAMVDRGDMPVGSLVAGSVGDPAIAAAYDAPFPDPRYKAGPLIMPQRVPVTPDDPARQANLDAWHVLEQWEKPLLTAFSDGDPITRGGDAVFQERVPGAKGQPHVTIEGAGHFLQEQKGEELARVINDFIANTPVRGKKTAGRSADDIPVAHTPEGFWTEMPPPVLAECTEPLVEGAPDLRGMWKVVSAEAGGQPTDAMVGTLQRIEQCGNRVVITAGGVVHDMRCDGTYENGVNDVAARTAQPISVAATFENGVHVLRPKGMPDITVTRERAGDDLIWHYGPSLVLRCQRVDTE